MTNIPVRFEKTASRAGLSVPYCNAVTNCSSPVQPRQSLRRSRRARGSHGHLSTTLRGRTCAHAAQPAGTTAVLGARARFASHDPRADGAEAPRRDPLRVVLARTLYLAARAQRVLERGRTCASLSGLEGPTSAERRAESAGARLGRRDRRGRSEMTAPAFRSMVALSILVRTASTFVLSRGARKVVTSFLRPRRVGRSASRSRMALSGAPGNADGGADRRRSRSQ